MEPTPTTLAGPFGIQADNCTDPSFNNCTVLRNHTDHEDDDRIGTAGNKAMTVINILLYSAVFVCGTLGNGAVVWVAGFRMKRSPVTVYFLSLAAVDFTFVATLPLLITLLVHHHWPFDHTACKVLPSFIIFNMYASVYLLSAISLDRYFAVVQPILALRIRSTGVAWVVCAVSLCAAALSTLPSFLYREVIEDDIGLSWCMVNYGEEEDVIMVAVGVFTLLAGFLLPLVAICFCYMCVVHKMRSMSRVHTSRRARSVRLIAAVVAAFFVCWFPYHILVVVKLVPIESEEAFHHLMDTMNFLQPLAVGIAITNSCVNPFLYVFVGREFRKTLLRSSPILRQLEAALGEEASGGSALSQQGTKSSSDSGQMSQVHQL
ncbi:C5a anaphylatoxin chemotactic receptor 1 [Lampetra fluviatilis]